MRTVTQEIDILIGEFGSRAKAKKKAMEWYQKALKSFRNNAVVKKGERFLPGKIYVFRYDTPVTENLQWWDRNPVVLALDSQNKNDLGINLNLIPEEVKETILNELHIKLNGQIKTETTRASQNASAQGQLNLTYDGAKRFLDQYGLGFAIRQYKPELKGKQAIVYYENWSAIVLCDFAQLEGINEPMLRKMYKKYYNSKHI